MKLPFTKKPSATIEELQQQLEDAQNAHEDAVADVDKALAEFDASGSDATEKALLVAREAEQTCREYVGRAERLLRAAEAREATAKKAALEAKLAGLQNELSRAALQQAEAPLVQAEVDALLVVAGIRAQRRELRAQYAKKIAELRTAKVALGLELSVREPEEAGVEELAGPQAVVTLIGQRSLEVSDPVRTLVRNLMPLRDAYEAPATAE